MYLKPIAGAAMLAVLATMGACSKPKPKPGSPATTAIVGGDQQTVATIGDLTVTVPPGAVPAGTKLTSTAPVSLAAETEGALKGVRTHAVRFDLSLAGDRQPAEDHPLAVSIRLQGAFLPGGAKPEGALLYTETDKGPRLVPAEVNNGVLTAELEHLSSKEIVYIDGQSVQGMLDAGAPSLVKEQCSKEIAVPPATQKLRLTEQNTAGRIEACLKTAGTQLDVHLGNQTQIMLGILATAGTVNAAPGTINDAGIRMFAGHLFPGNLPQGMITSGGTADVLVNPTKTPEVKVTVGPHASVWQAEVTWKAFQLALQFYAGKSVDDVVKLAEQMLVKVPDLENCLKTATTKLGNGSLVSRARALYDLIFSICGESLAKAAAVVLGDTAKGLAKIGRWFKRAFTIGSLIHDAFDLSISKTMEIVEQFKGMAEITIKPVAPACPSKAEFEGIVLKAPVPSGSNPIRKVEIPSGTGGITCDSGWAMATVSVWYKSPPGPPPPNDVVGYAAVLHWEGGKWVVAEGGQDLGDSPVCKQAPAKIRQRMNCR